MAIARGQVAVFGARAARPCPLAGATVRAFVPGTDRPWPDPLWLDPVGATPAAFPLAVGRAGSVDLWAPAPGWFEARVDAPGYAPRRIAVDLTYAVAPPALPPPAIGTVGAAPRVADFGRSMGQTTVFGAFAGATVPLGGAAVTVYEPGTDVLWSGPLYGGATAHVAAGAPGGDRPQRAAGAVGGRAGPGGTALPGARLRAGAVGAGPGAAAGVTVDPPGAGGAARTGGAAGRPGEQGAQGPTGATGPAGPTDRPGRRDPPARTGPPAPPGRRERKGRRASKDPGPPGRPGRPARRTAGPQGDPDCRGAGSRRDGRAGGRDRQPGAGEDQRDRLRHGLARRSPRPRSTRWRPRSPP